MDAIIIANGSFTASPALLTLMSQADLLIAADGGAVHLHPLGFLPKVIIGDMDSITPEVKAFYKDQETLFIPHPPAKDQTDTELCIDYALENGADSITLIGVTGERLDHTLANVFLLKPLADKNIKARIIDAHNEIYLVTRSMILEGNPGDILSLVPISETITGITLKGLEYPLVDASLTMGTAMGVSNCFTGTLAEISIESGMILAILSRD